MFLRVITIVLFVYFATSQGDENATEVHDAKESDLIWDGNVATWSLDINDGFYNLPSTIKAAESEGWTEIIGAETSADIKALGYKGDPRFTVCYSISSDEIIGYQIGFPVKDVAGLPINYDNHVGFTRKQLNGEDYYSGSLYFSKNKNTGVYEIWLQHNATFYDKIPIYTDLVTSETAFLEKNCIATMANPHYYVMNSTTDCSSLYPWFLLARDEYIVGIGFQAFGNVTSSPDRTWWEPIPLAGALLVISDPPPCLTDYFNDYGLISVHTWFIKDPYNITCSDA